MTLSLRITQAFDGFTLDADITAPAGLTVLFGRSGSGKSTLVNAVAGLMRPDRGRIAIGGRVLFDSDHGINVPVHKRRLGYVFQDARLFPHLTVAQNLRYGPWFAPRGQARPQLTPVIEMLGLGPLLDRRPATLSGGEKSRVALGRALLAGPELILADEPLAALDEARKADILPYFERLRDEAGVPILYVSHSPAEVARLATTVVALDAGRVSRIGPAAEVLSDPAVTPLGARATGAMLETTVVAHHADGLSELDARGVRLLLPRVPRDIGAALRIHVESQDVMLATQRPEGLSALNILPAEIREIRIGAGPGALVQLCAGRNLILSRVTRRSVQALGLQPGKQVWAVLKAVSVARENAAS